MILLHKGETPCAKLRFTQGECKMQNAKCKIVGSRAPNNIRSDLM